MKTIDVFILFFSAFLAEITAEIISGVVPLNSGSFDKVVSKHEYVLVKFDESYPYGDKQNAFKLANRRLLEADSLLVGSVEIYDYGDEENKDLAERFVIEKEDYPVYKLFTQQQGLDNPITFDGDTQDPDAIIKFVMKNTGLWIGLPACMKEFDLLAKEFITTHDAASREATLEEARHLAAEYEENEDKHTRANVYVKTMEKMLEKGDNFVLTEVPRVEKLLEGKLSDMKRLQLRDRLSILTSFHMSMNARDEL